MRTWALGQLGHVAAAVNPFEAEELASLRESVSGRQFPLGDLPALVISRGMPDGDSAEAKAEQEERLRDHAGVAALSRRGRQIIAEASGHHVQLEQPDLVVHAIRELLAR
jgi:pimeloyl-ACP methyl ester carboxylesterase